MRNKVLKTLSLFILLAILFIPSTAFAATQIYSSTETKNYSSAKTGRTYYLGPSETYSRFKTSFYHQINDGNKKYIAYCLDPNWNSPQNGAGKITGSKSPSLKNKYGQAVNMTLLKNIMAAGKQQGTWDTAAHFKNSAGKEEKRYYLATQILIWEVMMGGRTNYSTSLNTPANHSTTFDTYDFVKTESKLKDAYEGILKIAKELSDEGKASYSFGNKYILKWSDSKGKYVSTDTITVGSYTYSKNNSDVAVSKNTSNNTITITTASELSSYKKLTFNFKYGISLDEQFKWFTFNTSSGNQRMVLAYYQGSNSGSLEVKTESGKFAIAKYDLSTGKFVADSEFKIYKCKSEKSCDKSPVKTVSIPLKNNKAISDDITIKKSGLYKFVESKSPGNYNKLKDFFVMLTIDKDGKVSMKVDKKYEDYVKFTKATSSTVAYVRIYDEAKTFTISKLDGSDKKTKIKGATFQIKNSSGTVMKFKKLSDGNYEYNTSGKTTKLVSKNLSSYTVKGLPVGSYILEETAVPSPYELSGTASDRQTKFKIDKTAFLQTLNSSNKYVKNTDVVIKVYNYKARYFTISKVDADNNKVKVNGATFQIKNSSGTALKFKKTSEGNYEYNTSGTVTNLVSQKLSSYTVKSLPEGSYILEETAVPSPYKLPDTVSARQKKFKIDKTDYLQVLDSNNKYVKSTSATITVENKKSGSFVIAKVDGDDTSTQIKGATFQIKNSGGTVMKFNKIAAGSFQYSTSGTVTSLVDANSSSYVIADLPEGTYTLEETAVPSPYELPSSTSDRQTKFKRVSGDYLQVLNGSSYVKADKATITVKNYQAQSLTIAKIDGHDNKTQIKGATFQIKNTSGTVMKFTSANGVFSYNTSGTVTNIVDSSLSSYTIKGLPVGEYILEETAVPYPYLLSTNVNQRQTKFKVDKTDIVQVLDKNNKYVKADKATVKVKNYKTTVNINKTGSAGTVVPGVVFELYDANKTNRILLSNVGSEYRYDTSGTALNLTTNAKGKIVINYLPEGVYYLKEVEVPSESGLRIDPNNQWQKIVVTLNEKSNNIPKNISNAQGTFCFYKMDENGNYLDKGIFKLQKYNEEKNEFIDVTLKQTANKTFIIDESGSGSPTFTPVSGKLTCFEQVQSKTKYKIVEIEAPEGFILPTDKADMEVEVSMNEFGYANGDAVLFNKRITEYNDAEAQAELVVGISTGMNKINYVLIIGGIGLVIGILIFIKKKMDKK